MTFTVTLSANSAGFCYAVLIKILVSLSTGVNRAAISPKHLIASILELAGTKKFCRINGISSVSKM